MSCTSTGIAETAYIGSTCKGTVIYNSEISFTGCSPNEDTGTSLECTCPSTRTPTSVDGFPMWAIILVICVGVLIALGCIGGCIFCFMRNRRGYEPIRDKS